MSTYVIVEELGDWPCHADYLLTARTYLQHGVPTTGGRPRIINLCRNLEHLSAGYYCSLLAQARGHHVQVDLAGAVGPGDGVADAAHTTAHPKDSSSAVVTWW